MMDFSQIQNSYAAEARRLAEQLIDEHGSPHAFHGSSLEHQQNFLKKWKSDPQFVKKFRRFSLPLCHKRAEEMVRLSLQLPHSTSLKDFHVKRAAIAACLTPLRQTIGSCFATAPAILVQLHHLDLFVDDLYELLTTGRLKRVVEGQEYAVPLCPTLSSGNALLKAWEFTLASFCDIKTEFSRWNLSWSLGLDPQQPGGIGEVIYRALEEGLQEANQKAGEFHQSALEAFDQLKVTERLLRQAGTEAEIRRWRLEEQSRLYHMRSCEELRDVQQLKAGAYARFFPFLMGQYTKKFQDYFQEIYDPEMVEVSKDPYEDQRAGFRLVYKHGRSDSSLWTSIHEAQSFVKSLVDFLTVTEPLIVESCETNEEKKILEEVTTRVIQHVQSDLFIHSALEKAAGKGRTPWSYLSGGTLEQWMSIYFRESSPPAKEIREVENAMELFVFLLDTLKALPHALCDQFIQDPSKRLLIESPTHVFTLLPGLDFFQKGWLDRGFTYTWIRDNFLIPAQEFYEKKILSLEEQREILRRLSMRADVTTRLSVIQFCQRFASDSLPAFLHQILKAPACVFSDTNWQDRYFAFVVSPLTLQLEMWVCDKTGALAAPLPLIKTWFGKGKQFIWTIYTKKL